MGRSKRRVSADGKIFKICSGECNRELEENENNFYVNSKSPRRYRGNCISCSSKKAQVYYENNKSSVILTDEEKLDKVLYNKKYRENNKELIKIKRHNTYVINRETEIAYALEYNKNHSEHIKESGKRRRAEHKLEKSINNKKYYQENKDFILNKVKKYQKNNKEKINKRTRLYLKNRRANEPAFKLKQTISNFVRKMLKTFGRTKDNISIKLKLDYDINILKFNLEGKFDLLWMTWDNHGDYNAKTWNDNDPSTWTWQLDHIVPQALLPYDSMDHPNFKKAWHLNNLRPLSAKANNIKSDNIEYIPEGIFTEAEVRQLLSYKKINIRKE